VTPPLFISYTVPLSRDLSALPQPCLALALSPAASVMPLPRAYCLGHCLCLGLQHCKLLSRSSHFPTRHDA